MTVSGPVFVACNARSGSTLLRWLIDAHEQISCPGETDLATLVSAYAGSARAAGLAADTVLPRARAVVDTLMASHLEAAGKQRWCDKSLSNVAELEQLAEAWPEARFILLHRHCMDVTASLLEASEWGLDSFGLGSYAQMSPHNTVLAVCGYWIERTAAMLAFEQAHPGRCLRLRYEDLVTGTDASMAEVWQLFGVDSPTSTVDTFTQPHESSGPADYKIWHTRAVHAESIGRGARIPPERLGIPVRDAMNQLLKQLGYDLVGNEWGSGGGPIVRTDDGTLEIRVVDGHEVRARAVVHGFVPAMLGAPAPDDGGPPACVVAVERSALDGLCAGTENFGSALKRRAVRRYGDVPQRFGSEKDFLDGLAGYLGSSGWGLLASAEVMEAAAAEAMQCSAAGQH